MNRRIRTFFKSKDISFFTYGCRSAYQTIDDVSYSSLIAIEYGDSTSGCFYTDFIRLNKNYDPFLVDYWINVPVKMCEEYE